MHYPKLKFKIDHKKDVKTFFNFVNEAHFDGGRNLEWAVLNKYPYFRQYKSEDTLKVSKLIVEKFVKSIYLENKLIIDKNMSIYQKDWLKAEMPFYDLVDKLFLNYHWPKGKYIAFTTIWGMFPRFLEDKTFQIPFKCKNKKDIPTIIAHEMLHFIFYDYFYKHFPKYKYNKYNFFVWHISEIFNTFIQNSPKWLKVFKMKSLGYPEHDKIIFKLSKKYYKKSDWQLNDLIKDIIDMVAKEKFPSLF